LIDGGDGGGGVFSASIYEAVKIEKCKVNVPISRLFMVVVDNATMNSVYSKNRV
jgi:hypothetical protein